MELETLSHYVRDSAPKQLSTGSKKQYFNCHRSHAYKPKGKNVRSLKSTGSNKIGKACPSRMEVVTSTQDEKCVIKVQFYKNHYGHDLGLGHIKLSKEIRAEIAGMQENIATFL